MIPRPPCPRASGEPEGASAAQAETLVTRRPPDPLQAAPRAAQGRDRRDQSRRARAVQAVTPPAHPITTPTAAQTSTGQL